MKISEELIDIMTNYKLAYFFDIVERIGFDPYVFLANVGDDVLSHVSDRFDNTDDLIVAHMLIENANGGRNIVICVITDTNGDAVSKIMRIHNMKAFL